MSKLFNTVRVNMIGGRVFTLLQNARPIQSTAIRQIKNFGHGRDKVRSEQGVVFFSVGFVAIATFLKWPEIIKDTKIFQKVSAESITHEYAENVKIKKNMEGEKREKQAESDDSESSEEEEAQEVTEKKKKKKAKIGFRDRKVETSVN